MDFQEAQRRRDASVLAPEPKSESADRRASDARLRRAIRDVFARERAGRDERAGDPVPGLKLVRDAPR